MPKILPLAEISTIKGKSQKNSNEIGATSKAVRHEIDVKKRKVFNIERRQIGLKRSCQENQKPMEVKCEEDDFSEEDTKAEEPVEVKREDDDFSEDDIREQVEVKYEDDDFLEDDIREQVEVKYEEEYFTEENFIEENLKTRKRKTNPINIDKSTEDQEDISDRVTILVDRKGAVTYQCTRCLKLFRYMSHFEVHERAHILTKLFSCNLCNKTFSHQNHLKAHEMVHTNMGPYRCRVCSKRLASTTALGRHLVTHTGEKAFNCFNCKKAFAQKIQLIVHMRTHTGTRPFTCGICKAMFTQKSHLKGHIKVHTGEKPYKCVLCYRQFRKPYSLNMHKKCHQRKPFQCKSCDFLFKEVEIYKRHINRHLLGVLPLKIKSDKPKHVIIDELEKDLEKFNKLKEELKTE